MFCQQVYQEIFILVIFSVKRVLWFFIKNLPSDEIGQLKKAPSVIRKSFYLDLYLDLLYQVVQPQSGLRYFYKTFSWLKDCLKNGNIFIRQLRPQSFELKNKLWFFLSLVSTYHSPKMGNVKFKTFLQIFWDLILRTRECNIIWVSFVLQITRVGTSQMSFKSVQLKQITVFQKTRFLFT